MSVEKWKATQACEEAFEWSKYSKSIPFIEFPSGWKIKMRPPFTGAMVRFFVSTDGIKNEDGISVYLDCHDHLGCFGEPYWEIYPYQEDVGRCAMADVDELLKMIGEQLNLMK